MQALQNITQTYDNNGNLTGDGTWTHTWNYKNQITQSTKAGATTTYAYDYAGNRIKNQESGVTTITPNSFYSITGATTTKHIFANGNLVATVERYGTTTPTIRYVATDHLRGTSAITNASGVLIESTDYNPYGTIRVDQKTGSYSEKRKYAGTEFDASTGLNYMMARYQNGAQGRFISQDPVFWEKQNLKDPQSLNSYSYANDNPINLKDTTGRAAGIDDAIGFIGGGIFGVGYQFIEGRATGNGSTAGQYFGSFVTGGIIGLGVVNSPETFGASNAVSASVVSGLTAGYYGNLAKQSVDIMTGIQKGGLNTSEMNNSALTVAVTNGVLGKILPDAKIPGLSSGKGNLMGLENPW